MNGGVCFPARFPTGLPPVLVGSTLARPEQQRPRLDRAHWSAIAERARHESLRDLAAEDGVSRETIRTITRRVWGAVTAPMATD
jgi:hypothetical protein